MKTNTISALLTSSAFLFTAAVATGQTPQQTQPRDPQQQTQPRDQRTQQRSQADPMAEMTLQGCLAHDESRGMVGASKQVASAQTFVLKNVSTTGSQPGATSRQPGSTDQQPRTGQGYGTQAGQQGQRPGAQQGQQRAGEPGAQHHAGMKHDSEKMYRVVASQADMDLAKHVGHTVEVKGRLTPAAQPEQRTQGDTPPPQTATSFENEHKTLTITSLRHISETCTPEQSDIR